MSIYDLNNPSFLDNDIEEIFEKIAVIYDVRFGLEDEYIPKTIVDSKKSWASQECHEAFNRLIPPSKSLVKDMYSVLENLYKGKKGKFDREGLEIKYPNLKKLRWVNNKFKHYFDTNPTVQLTALTLLEKRGHMIDIIINFNLSGELSFVRFSDLIKVFLQILEDEKIITITRT